MKDTNKVRAKEKIRMERNTRNKERKTEIKKEGREEGKKEGKKERMKQKNCSKKSTKKYQNKKKRRPGSINLRKLRSGQNTETKKEGGSLNPSLLFYCFWSQYGGMSLTLSLSLSLSFPLTKSCIQHRSFLKSPDVNICKDRGCRICIPCIPLQSSFLCRSFILFICSSVLPLSLFRFSLSHSLSLSLSQAGGPADPGALEPRFGILGRHSWCQLAAA